MSLEKQLAFVTLISTVLIYTGTAESSEFSTNQPDATDPWCQMCTCIDETSIDCSGNGLGVVPAVDNTNITSLILQGNRLTWIAKGYFDPFPNLEELHLGDNEITLVEPGSFTSLVLLRVLDLSSNNLTILSNQMFSGLSFLQVLRLSSNTINIILPGCFDGLPSLTELDLSGNELVTIPSLTFNGISSLQVLNLSRNNIDTLDDEAFSELSSLESLDLRNNRIKVIQQGAFNGLSVHPATILSDDWRVCCVANASGLPCSVDEAGDLLYYLTHLEDGKHEERDPFSSCKDLMYSSLLRSFVWAMGIFATGFNLGVIIWRLISRYRVPNKIVEKRNRISRLLALCLGFGDLCMGVFLLIIATADQVYRGYYVLQNERWTSSFTCHFAGFLSVFAMEFSMFILAIITIERYTTVLNPVGARKITYGLVKVAIVIGLLVSLILAALPLMSSFEYFRNFYGRSSVCLALPFLSNQPNSTATETFEKNGFGYSFFVFIILNCFSVNTVICSYLVIFCVVTKTRKKTASTANKDTMRLIQRIAIIVATDVACWLPIKVLGFTCLLGYGIPKTVYAWIALIVLPINSAINPLIYTFYTHAFRKGAQKKVTKLTQTISQSLSRPSKVDDAESAGSGPRSPNHLNKIHVSTVQTRSLSDRRSKPQAPV